ncbi:PACE efflux transporter [Pseudoruegeria sp. SK021]|uniref:PACE efflux transporter n=1 Tax=Pseudoruegeria sp. SK021 TaxID=1933035 RepID=UPI000A2395E3|nr:PACE efflux transporter [Pseudoruegeria sp. SK021]OSP54517.1 hypothetical protein BV911_12345 [Pseudoruegeria sp. SK021]
MRTSKDRLRHAISFEIFGLALITPLGAWAFGTPMGHIGIVALVGATIATVWNYVYNLVFDKAMMRSFGHTRKTLWLRLGHAVLFEIGILVSLLPFIAWYMGISVMQALWMDIGFAGFYLVYALVFNWVYDVVFPVPGPRVLAGAD